MDMIGAIAALAIGLGILTIILVVGGLVITYFEDDSE